MRIVYFSFPARSHTVPSLALVGELVRGGASVEYHSIGRFQGLIKATGATFVGYPEEFDQLPDPTGMGGSADPGLHAERLAGAAERILPGLRATVPCPDLVIFDASAPWGRTLGQEWRAPLVAFVTTFAFQRGMLGLMGIRDAQVLDILAPEADLKLICTSRYFQPSGRHFDEKFVFVGPLLAHRPEEGVVVRREGDRPLAYVSLGTIFNRDLALVRRITGILAADGWQVAVSLGNAGHDASGGWPEGVRVYPFVNQMAALAVADLAVTHGGMGSISEILAAEVPAIVVPQGADQFLVGRRTAQLGAAVVVETSADDVEWAAALARVRTEREAFRSAARLAAESFNEVTPIDAAAGQVLAQATETAFLGGVFAEARTAMEEASSRQPFPPRFTKEGARCMAGHLGMPESRMKELLRDAALYQVFLPAAIVANPAQCQAAARNAPVSFEKVRSALAAVEQHPQVVVLAFHMSGLPLVSSLVDAAWTDLDAGPKHLLLAARNMSWLTQDSGSWVAERGTILGADRAGLRQLLTGLRAGTIRRLLAMVDGPQAPGGPGTRALSGISAGLGFRTGLVSTVLGLGIPILPLLHFWDGERLVVECGPVLTSVDNGIDAMAGHIESLLRRHPEQWLNWPAASLRTPAPGAEDSA